MRRLFVVCSPRLLEGPDAIRKPGDIARHTLLSDLDWRIDVWQIWFEAAGLGAVEGRRALSFNYSNLMLQAAVDGLGVALSQHALAGDDLAAGRLVRPFDISLPTEYAYYVVMPEASAERPKIAAFRNWLKDEAKAGKEAAGSPEAPAWKAWEAEGSPCDMRLLAKSHRSKAGKVSCPIHPTFPARRLRAARREMRPAWRSNRPGSRPSAPSSSP